MTTQITTTPTDVTVNSVTGMATITRAGLARRLNVHQNTLKNYLYGRGKTQGNQPLDEDSVLDTVAYFAHNAQTPTQEAKDLLVQISKAGTKAWLYNEAGYRVQAVPVQENIPQTHIQAVEAYLQTLKKLEAKAQVITTQAGIIETKQVETDASTESFTIRRIRLLNKGVKIDPKILLKVCKTLGTEPTTVFDLYEQKANSYHRDVWEEAYPDVILP